MRQGGHLSPILFNFYMNGLTDRLNASNLGCKLRDVRTNHLGYADDFVLIANSIVALQQLVHICSDFADDHDVIYNVRKTHCMYICRNSRSKESIGRVTLNNAYIDIVDCEKYLGHMFTSDLSDVKDITRQTTLFYIRANTLIRNFGKCSMQVKSSLVRAYCINFYCNSLWCFFQVYYMERLRIAYNRLIRKFFRLSYDSSISRFCVTHNIPTFGEIRRRSIYSIGQRVALSDNKILRAICGLKTSRSSPFWHNYYALLLP